jgi:hypothetical protein
MDFEATLMLPGRWRPKIQSGSFAIPMFRFAEGFVQIGTLVKRESPFGILVE